MKEKINIRQLRELCSNVDVFPSEVLEWIREHNLWNLWVPKEFGGLELPFGEGIHQLKSLAKIDGSLGWTVTLCSGANFFIGNLQPRVAKGIFGADVPQVCFGGSGGVFGTAERQGGSYLISGRWRYATGASYLTHFTLNARILEKGKEVRNTDGSPKVRSFVLPRNKVAIIEDWNTMGLKASVTHSFDVNDVLVDGKYSFLYNQVNLDHPIFKIPFSIFADLTLWANYIGMAEHFLDEASKLLPKEQLVVLTGVIEHANRDIIGYAQDLEASVADQLICTEESLQKIHFHIVGSVKNITSSLIGIYPFLGVAASRESNAINQIFRDYFTATQHHIFTMADRKM